MFSVSNNNSAANFTDLVVVPVLTADKLLGRARYKSIIRQLKEFAQVPDEHFEVLYMELIRRFAEFVQLIPSQLHGTMGGLLNMGLARGMTAIGQFVTHYGKAELDALNCYAVFSVGLLVDISRAVVNQKVIITDEHGNYETAWRPFMGSMLHLGKYYRLMEIAPGYRRLEVAINSILARQVMPETGFLWLSSHWRVFADWLDALNGGGAGGDRLAHLLSLIKPEDLLEWMRELQGSYGDFFEPDANEHGERFFRWLKEGIDKGTLEVNTPDARIHVLEDGVFVDKQLFKQYADLVRSPVNIHTVFTQFGNAMGIVKRSEHDFLTAMYHSADEGTSKKVGFIGRGKRSGKKAEGVRVDAEILLKQVTGTSSCIRVSSSRGRSLPELKDKALQSSLDRSKK